MKKKNSEYADRLKQLRTALVKSKVRTADELGISKEQYEKYENGEDVISPAIIGKLVIKYKMSIKWFATGKNGMFRSFLKMASIPDFGSRNSEVGQLLGLMKKDEEFYWEIITLFRERTGKELY